MVTSDFRPEVQVWPFYICTMKNMHYNPHYMTSSVIVDSAVRKIPCSTERILGGEYFFNIYFHWFLKLFVLQARFLLSKVNPSQTHNNMYATAWGQQVSTTGCCKYTFSCFYLSV